MDSMPHIGQTVPLTGGGGWITSTCSRTSSAREIKVEFSTKIEALVIEVNLKKRNWLLIGSYNPHKHMIGDHLNSLTNCLNQLCKTYENIILLGDFNSEICEDTMKLLCSSYNLKNLINEPTCFKNLDNPSCIDLVLTDKSSMTGLSDIHRLTMNHESFRYYASR